MSKTNSRPSSLSEKVTILGGIVLFGLVLATAFLAGTKGLAAQTDPSPSPQTRERRTLPDDQVPFVVIGVLALTIIPVVLGIKAAKRKGVSPHWMWFGVHPVGGWIAYLVIRSRPDRYPAPPPRVGQASKVPMDSPAVAPAQAIAQAARTVEKAAPAPPANGLVNRGERQDDLQQAMAYWIERFSCPVKDPFVMYWFDTEKDAHEALLDLPCIHVGHDGKLICTEPLIFGYYRQSNGLYEALICGDRLTHDLWERAKSCFESHGGRRKNDLEPEMDGSPAPPAGPSEPPATSPISYTAMFKVLADLCYAYQQNDRAAIDRLEPVARAIGEELNRRGGKKAMLAMWESLENRPGARTLDMHWHGIGEWLG